MKTTKEDVEEFIEQLEIEADACEEVGSNFSASAMRNEVDRLNSMLRNGIIPQDLSRVNNKYFNLIK